MRTGDLHRSRRAWRSPIRLLTLLSATLSLYALEVPANPGGGAQHTAAGRAAEDAPSGRKRFDLHATVQFDTRLGGGVGIGLAHDTLRAAHGVQGVGIELECHYRGFSALIGYEQHGRSRFGFHGASAKIGWFRSWDDSLDDTDERDLVLVQLELRRFLPFVRLRLMTDSAVKDILPSMAVGLAF